MDSKDLCKTSELPAVELVGGRQWLYNHDPLGVFSHRLETADNAKTDKPEERTE